MMTWPRGQDNGQTGNRHPVPAFGTGPAVGETADDLRARLASLWALVLLRFRAYAHRESGLDARPERADEEEI